MKIKNIHGGGDFFTGVQFLTISMLIARTSMVGVTFSRNSSIIHGTSFIVCVVHILSNFFEFDH